MAEYGLEIIEKHIKQNLLNELDRTGILFRLFSRIKNNNSIVEKFTRKNYSIDGKLMQDLIGFRITTYFEDDIKLVVSLCEKLFEKVELVYDEPNTDIFRPLRKNMICRIPKDDLKTFTEIQKVNPKYGLVDNTFEIQFRTTLSEGWHEVDHLMRYKCKPEWERLTKESRILNGIYATLETNDQTLIALFDRIAHQHYKSKRWEAMLRNKLRLRFMLQELNPLVSNYLDQSEEVGKQIFRLNREKVLSTYINSKILLSTTFDNWLFFINHCFIKDEFISQETPSVLKEELKLVENENKK